MGLGGTKFVDYVKVCRLRILVGLGLSSLMIWHRNLFAGRLMASQDVETSNKASWIDESKFG